MQRSLQQRLLLATLIVTLAHAGTTCSAAITAHPATKTLRLMIAPGVMGVDPAQYGDSTSQQLQEALFDRLLTYDYLARPAKLVPLAAASMPTVSNQGKTFTFRLIKGISFGADAAFAAQPRELAAEDVAYSIKRHADPANKSPNRDLFVDKIVGLAALEQKALAAGRFDYDSAVAGLEIVDRNTVRIHLTETDYDFAYVFAHPASSIVAREIMESPLGNRQTRAVGTGPYELESWLPDEKITLRANPNYRTTVWRFEGADDALVTKMRGKKIPQIQRIDIQIEKDSDARWRSFAEGNTDYFDRLSPAATKLALVGNTLAAALTARGIVLHSAPEPEIIYYYLNLRDPIVGGSTPEKKALRRAILQSFDVEEEIREIRGNVGRVAYSPIPPGVNGHDPGYRTQLAYDPAQANKSLDAFGFRRGKDGWRTMPDGSPLIVTFSSEPLDVVKPYAALRKKGLAQIGIKMDVRLQSFKENIAMSEKCDLAFWGSAWRARLPTAQYFFQLLYGANINKGNLACYQSTEFDALYDQAKMLPDGTERQKLHTRMARQIEEDGVWQLGTNRSAITLLKPRVIGYARHPMLNSLWQYLDLQEPNP